MTMETVESMFGADAVKLALDEPRYADIDKALLAKLDAAIAKQHLPNQADEFNYGTHRGMLR